MDRFELQKLRDLPIEGVAERLGLRVRMHKCLCPFHEDHHPSMSLKKSHYRCFVCGASGGPIDLVMKSLNKDFLEATKWLANENNIILDEWKPQASEPKHFDASRYEKYFSRPWLNDEAQKFLFEERKLDPRVVRWCRLTSWRDKKGVPWLQIPYYNQEGKLIGVQNRNLVRGAKPRFRFTQGSQCGIYNLPVLNMLKPDDELYITEGCSDCWAMLSSGHKAIAIPSATLLTNDVRGKMEEVRDKLSISFHMWRIMTSQANDCSYSCKKCCPRSSTTSCRPGAKILESTTSDDNPALSSNNPALFTDKRGLLEPLFGA